MNTTAFRWAALVLVGVLAAADSRAAPALDLGANRAECDSPGNTLPPEARVKACTVVIESQNYSYDQLGIYYHLRATQRHALGDYKNALDDLVHAFRAYAWVGEHSTSRVQAFELLGDLWRALGKTERALAAYDAAKSPQAQLSRAVALYAAGRFAEAAKAFEAIAKAPTVDFRTLRPTAHLWRFLARSRAGEQARPELGAANRELGPVRNQANVLMSTPGPQEAAATSDCWTAFAHGEMHLAAGNRDLARVFLERATSVCSPADPAYDVAASSLASMGAKVES